MKVPSQTEEPILLMRYW